MNSLLKTLIPYLLAFIIGCIGAYFYFIHTQQINRDAQIKAALGDTLKVVKLENSTLYQRIINIERINQAQEDYLNSKILILTTQNIKLRGLIDIKEGELVEEKNKNLLPGYTEHSTTYSHSNILRDLKVKVSNLINLDTNYKPLFNVVETYNDIPIINYITLDGDNIFGSTTEVLAPFDKILTIRAMKTVFNEEALNTLSKVFKSCPGDDPPILSIIPNISILNAPTIEAYYGAKILLGNKYLIGVANSMDSKTQIFDAGVKFDIF